MRVTGVLLVLLGLLATAFFGFVPGFVEGRMNTVREHAPWPVPERARALHARLQVADLHADPLLWGRDLLERGTRGQVDFPRLLEGNVTLQVFTAVTRSPRGQNYARNAGDAADNVTPLAIAGRWPLASWSSLAERALWQAGRLRGFAERDAARVQLVLTGADLDTLLARRARGERVVGALLGTEGSHALDGDLANIARLREAGYRIMGLQHFFDNALGGSLHGESKAGLTDFGRAAVREMERQGIVIDVAHSSPAVVGEVLAMAGRPIVVSHTGIHSHCPGPRNLPDALLERVAAQGGLVGIGFWKDAICDDTPAGVAGAIAAAVALLGPDAVALGSDYDGAVTTAFDASELAALTAALLDRGLPEETIAAVMGGNQLRFLRAQLPAR
jgi:microsomal dipeptidase-like Zn-dependent dipeptidase